MHGLPVPSRVTSLHAPCGHDRWDAALALLAASALVDVAGDIGGSAQTKAKWVRSSPACKHRGVQLAVAARASAHAAQVAAASKDLPASGAGAVAGKAFRRCLSRSCWLWHCRRCSRCCWRLWQWDLRISSSGRRVCSWKGGACERSRGPPRGSLQRRRRAAVGQRNTPTASAV